MMTRPPAMRARLQLIAASLALYLAACALPALRFTYDNGELQVMPGFAAALMGWTAMFVLNFGWLANVAYFPGLLMFLAGWWTAALAASITALLLALQSLMLWGVTIPADEANVRKMSLTGLEPGFYAWIAAIAALVVMSFLANRSRRSL
jgi:hypothetical protein